MTFAEWLNNARQQSGAAKETGSKNTTITGLVAQSQCLQSLAKTGETKRDTLDCSRGICCLRNWTLCCSHAHTSSIRAQKKRKEEERNYTLLTLIGFIEQTEKRSLKENALLLGNMTPAAAVVAAATAASICVIAKVKKKSSRSGHCRSTTAHPYPHPQHFFLIHWYDHHYDYHHFRKLTKVLKL